MASDMKVNIIEFFHAEKKIASIDIYQYLLNIYET